MKLKAQRHDAVVNAWLGGEIQSAVGKRYGVSQMRVGQILRRRVDTYAIQQQRRNQQRLEIVNSIKALQVEGLNNGQIAKHLGYSIRSIQWYIKWGRDRQMTDNVHATNMLWQREKAAYEQRIAELERAMATILAYEVGGKWLEIVT